MRRCRGCDESRFEGDFYGPEAWRRCKFCDRERIRKHQAKKRSDPDERDYYNEYMKYLRRKKN